MSRINCDKTTKKSKKVCVYGLMKKASRVRIFRQNPRLYINCRKKDESVAEVKKIQKTIIKTQKNGWLFVVGK